MFKGKPFFFLGIVFVVILIIIYSISGEEVDQKYIREVQEYRTDKNELFAFKEASPLDRRQKKLFDSLDYYPINAAYRVKAKFQHFDIAETVEMPTTLEKKRLYTKYGKLTFTLKDQEHSLTVFKSLDRLAPDVLFIPFTDETSGFETYGAGRYLDIEPFKGNKTTVDFNMAYNPYCAYNTTYDCPLPPRENNLQIEVLAGEKKFN